MDENSPKISPAIDKNSPIPCLPSSPQEFKANDLDSATSPRRPLRNKTMTSINSSQQKPASGKDAVSNDKEPHSDTTATDESHHLPTSTSPQLVQKQRHSNQHMPNSSSDDDDGIGDDIDNKTRLNSKRSPQPRPIRMTNPKASETTMVAAIGEATTAAAAAVEVTASTSKSMVHISTEKSLDDRSGVDDLESQAVDPVAALAEEKEKTTRMLAWGKDMEQLIRRFKEVRDDVIDSVDILVEYEQVTLAFEHEKQLQAEVDDLMNLVAERLFEVEEAKQQLMK